MWGEEPCSVAAAVLVKNQQKAVFSWQRKYLPKACPNDFGQAGIPAGEHRT